MPRSARGEGVGSSGTTLALATVHVQCTGTTHYRWYMSSEPACACLGLPGLTCVQADGLEGDIQLTETLQGADSPIASTTQLWVSKTKAAYVITTAKNGTTSCAYAGSTWALQPSHNPCFGTSTKQAWNQTTPTCANGTGCELQQTTADSLTSVLGNFSGGMCTPRTRSVCFPPTAGANGTNGTAAQFTTTTFGAMQTGAALPANAFAVPVQCPSACELPTRPKCDLACTTTQQATVGCCSYKQNETFHTSYTQQSQGTGMKETFELWLGT